MSENEPEKPRKGWGWLPWSVVAVVLSLLAIFVISAFGTIIVKRDQMRDMSKLRGILGQMYSYAAEHSGHYPDHGKDVSTLTSNAVFRSLIQDGTTQEEWSFGSSWSRFKPDGNIGTAPDYKEAVAAGENHWMMVAGLTRDSPGHYPLVIENTLEAAWPPTWEPALSKSSWWFAWMLGRMPGRGRCWQNNQILIGCNDVSVGIVRLKEKDGLLHLPPSVLKPEGKEALQAMKLLDVE